MLWCCAASCVCVCAAVGLCSLHPCGRACCAFFMHISLSQTACNHTIDSHPHAGMRFPSKEAQQNAQPVPSTNQKFLMKDWFSRTNASALRSHLRYLCYLHLLEQVRCVCVCVMEKKRALHCVTCATCICLSMCVCVLCVCACCWKQEEKGCLS